MFHGHTRTWKDCYQSFFDNVFSIAPGDIYMHTWDRVNSKYGSFWTGKFDRLVDEQEQLSSQTLDLDSIKTVYNPKHIIIETDSGLELPLQELPQIKTINANSAHIAAYNMVKSQYLAFTLAEKYGEYDIYFSCRPDLFFPNKLDITELSETDYMMVPPTFENYDDPRTEMIFDIFAFGPKNIMSIRAGFYHHIWDYWYSKNNLLGYFLEHAATKYFRDNNIKAKPSSLTFEVKRLF